MVLTTLAVALPASGQGHEHGEAGPIVLAHDGPSDGRQFVGNLAHFAAIARGDDAVPDFHQDLPVRVSLNGRVLFETTSGSGHDYDGINIFDVVFPEPGPYQVEALDASGAVAATLSGVVLPAPTLRQNLTVQEAGPILVGQPVTFSYQVHGDDAAVATPHTDCWFEVLQSGKTQFRTKTHTHETAQELQYAFPVLGPHVVRVTCFQAFPSAKAILFAPVIHEQVVDVLPGLPLDVLALGTTTPPTALNAVVVGASGGALQLVGTLDPYTVVGPDTLQHLVAAVVDPATGVPRQHVDFQATFTSPTGVLFSSATLHEYDGLFELSTRQAVPGIYRLVVTADAGDWSDTITLAYTVAPAVVPTTLGPVGYQLATFTMEGQASDYLFGSLAATGPFAHSEIELRVQDAAGRPVLVTKLHTHDDGTFPFKLGLPPGSYQFLIDGFPLTPEAALVSPASFDVDAPEGQVATEANASPGKQSPGKQLPGPAWPLLVMALALVLLGRRR